jgi:hypothetical protein
MTHLFPAELDNVESIDSAALAAAGIREVVTVDGGSEVTYAFEMEAGDAMLFELLANGRVDVVLAQDDNSGPPRALLASTATVLHKVTFRAPDRLALLVSIRNRRADPARCQIHAVHPLSAVGKRPDTCSRDLDGLPIVQLNRGD